MIRYAHYSLLIAIISISTSLPLVAQKIGHVNYGNLLEGLSDVQLAQSKHESYRDSLTQSFQEEVKTHRENIEQNALRYKNGELTPQEAESINAMLNENEQRLSQKQVQIERMILDARRVLMEPIIRRVKTAIEQYGREEGYLFILDEASGFLLYDQPTDDLTDIIRDRLES